MRHAGLPHGCHVPRSIAIDNDGTMIDLRSDTVTQPTPAMRRAMAEASG